MDGQTDAEAGGYLKPSFAISKNGCIWSYFVLGCRKHCPSPGGSTDVSGRLPTSSR